jgi:hypothetical protein
MGHAYLDYAQKKPLEYRLMFGTPWPEPAQHPELIANAVHAFDILRNSLRETQGDTPEQQARADLDALFIWSALHGMASISNADVMRHLVLAPGVIEHFRQDLMGKIGAALAAPAADAPPADAAQP